MPISTWDGYTVFLIMFVIFIVTFLFGLATKRVYLLQLKAHEEDFYRKISFSYTEKVFMFLAFVVVVLFVGLQMSNSDYKVYKYLFEHEYSASYKLLQFEGLFRAINKFVYDVFHEYQFVAIILAIITNLFMFNNVIYYAIQSMIKPKYAMFLYLSMYLLVSLGMQRQICAAAIVLFSFRFIERKKYLKYFLLTVLAMWFHSTAIISVLFFCFLIVNDKTRQLKLFYKALIIIAFYIVIIFSNQILTIIGTIIGRYNYAEYYSIESIGIGNLVYRLPVLIFLIFFRNTIKEAPRSIRMFASLVFLEVLACFSYYFVPMLGGRLQYYILFGYTIIIPYCFKQISNSRNSLLLYRVIIYVYGLFYLFYQLLTTEWITKYLMPIQFYHLFG